MLGRFEEKPRNALLGTGPPDTPDHIYIYGDLCSIWPKHKIAKMRKVQRRFAREHRRRVRLGLTTHHDGIEEKWRDMLTALDAILHGVTPASTSYCHRHCRQCPIPQCSTSSFCFHVAGSTCVDFSTRSSTRMGLLGGHMILFLFLDSSTTTSQ